MSAQESVNDTEAGILSHTYTLDIPYDQIIALNEGYLDTATAVTERYQKDFGRWSDFWVSRVDENHEFSTYLNTMAELSNLPDPTAAPPNGQIAPPAVECCAINGEWELEGPFYYNGNHQRSGIVFSVYSHPSQFPNTVYAGSGAGGLWKTTNAGQNWTCLTDGLRMPGIGVPDIVGHPSNPNEILVATGFRRRAGKAYGFGVLKSTDGGDNFTMSLNWSPVSGQVVYDLEIDPSNSQIVYAAANRAIHRSTDFGDTWDVVAEAPNNDRDYVEVKVVDDNTSDGAIFSVFEPFTSGNTPLEIWFSETGADGSFSTLPTPANDPNNTCQIKLNGRRAYLATSAATQNTLFVMFHSDCSHTLIVYKLVKDSSTGNWEWEFLRNLSMVANYVGSPSKSFPAFEVSQTDPTIFYVGGVHIKRFDVLPQGGTINYTSVPPTDHFGDNLWGTVHDDTRAIQVITSTVNGANDHLLIGTDGGISYTTTGLTQSNSSNWTNMNGHGTITTDPNTNLAVDELCITEFFDMDVAPHSYRNVFGGAQDNGTMDSGLMGPNPGVRTSWGDIDGGDGGASLFDWAYPNRYFWRANYNLKYSGGGSYGVAQCEPNTPSSTAGCTKTCILNLPNTDQARDIFANFKLRQHPFDDEKIYVAKGWMFQSLNRNISTPLSNITRNFYREFSRCEGKIATFELSPSDPDIIYLSKDDVPNDEQLYRSNDGGQNWNVIDDNINIGGWSQANYWTTRSIVIDPLDPNRLWCGLNGFGNSGNQTCSSGHARVVELVSQDGGATYLETDISTGLPPLPINTLIREDMSGVMYAGTDVGVYRYDPNTASPTWECFNMGLPPAIVLDLEINHCENRIYAATHGRGIFSSALPTSPEILVTTDQTWAAGPAMYAHNNIIISNGATLTINTTLFMSPDTRIEVEPGAELRVISGTITAACDNTWQGIYVEGDASAYQLSSLQGKVFLFNATIEHAHDAITTRKLGVAKTGGGIVQARYSTFRDNKRAVEFIRYISKFPNSSSEIGNASYFNQCDFEMTDEHRFTYTAASPVKPFVTMNQVNGIRFLACDFNDLRTGSSATNPSDKVGILAGMTGFSVNKVGSIASTFNDLAYGIQVQSESNNISFGATITNSEFDCWHGVYVNAVEFSPLAIQENNFNVKSADMPDGVSYVPSYGIYVDNCYDYSVENNILVSENNTGGPGAPIPDQHAGVVVRNLHGESTVVYNNEFTNFSVGCEAISQNRNDEPIISEAIGLEFRCNEFNDGRVDIFSSPDLNVQQNVDINGIKPIQDLPANEFSDPVIALHLYNYLGAEGYTYRHHDETNDPRVEPTLYTNHTPSQPRDVELIDTDIERNENTCPDNLADDDDDIGVFGGIKDIKNVQILNTLNTLQTTIDNGNTPLLVAAINHPRPRRSFRAYVNIMQQAPFTSNEVLETVSKKETGWSKGMIRNVLRQHPQAAKSATIQKNLDNRINQLPLFMRNQINQGLTIISEKEQMELDISTYKRERNLAINQAVQLLAADSIDRTADMLDFFTDNNDRHLEYRLAAAHSVLGDTDIADNILTAIGNMELSEAEAEAHADYLNFRQLIQTWETADKNLSELSEADLDILESYAQNTNAIAGKAIALLKINGINTYQEPVYFPGEAEQELRIAQYVEEEISEDKLLIYPNPASEYLIVDYETVGEQKELNLTITNINGQTIYEEKLRYARDEIIVITDKFPSGEYFCTLSSGTNIISTEKFILIK